MYWIGWSSSWTSRRLPRKRCIQIRLERDIVRGARGPRRVSPAIERTKLRATSTRHSSVEKGIGRRVAPDQLRLVDTTTRLHSMRAHSPTRLPGPQPGLVPSRGRHSRPTSSSAIDPFPKSSTSLAGTTSGCTSTPRTPAPCCGAELRPLVNAGSTASKLVLRPAQVVLTNFDCDVFYVRIAALISSLSVLPEYLRNEASESGAVIDYRDWHVPLGRRSAR